MSTVSTTDRSLKLHVGYVLGQDGEIRCDAAIHQISPDRTVYVLYIIVSYPVYSNELI